MPFFIQQTNGLAVLQSPALAEQDGLAHGFSTRPGGISPAPWDSLNLGVGRGDESAHVEENFRRFSATIGTDVKRVVLAKQVHSDAVRPVTEADSGKGLWQPRDYQADALVTNVPELALTVFSADCGVMLLYDPRKRAIGAVHAGWRGVANGILRKSVEEMTRIYGSDPADLLAAIGPAIGPCCFETDDDVPAAMEATFGDLAAPHMERRDAKWRVDLKGLNRQWLLLAGLRAEHIQTCDLCTACHPELFWSHRKMGEQRGAQIAQIALL